jgi:3-hydroxyacyl-[acyl-carrier-protein] dehydratase
MFPAVTDLIPHRAPFLFVDEILAAGPDTLTARRAWRAEEAFYAGHYPGAPITPGVILCECVVQTGALLVALGQVGKGAAAGTPILAKISDVRFRQSVFPGDTTTMEVRLKEWIAGFGLMSGVMKRGDHRVLNIDFTVLMKETAPGPGARGP